MLLSPKLKAYLFSMLAYSLLLLLLLLLDLTANVASNQRCIAAVVNIRVQVV
jgi:hypothetical protein